AEATSPAGALVSYAAATVANATTPVTFTYSAESGSVFALGSTPVTVTAQDGLGNTATAVFTVLVADTTAPALTVPGEQLFEATSPAGALVFYAGATATDAVGPVTFTYGQVSGTQFAYGATAVSVTATDAFGNASNGSFTIAVRDTTAPALSVPADVLADATSSAGAIVFYAAATATDAV